MYKKYKVSAKDLLNLSRKELQELDGKMTDRQRLTGSEIDALIRINAACCLLDTAIPDLEGLIARTGAKMLKPVAAHVVKLCQKLAMGVPLTQIRTVEANTANSFVICSADQVPQFTNVRHEYLSEIVKQASKQCDLECTKTREQSKQCPLRRAFENIPGMKEAARANANDAEHCPYTMIQAPDL